MSTSLSTRVPGMASAEIDRVDVGWTVAGIAGLIALLVGINGFPERIGVLVLAADPASFVPLLSPAFLRDILPRLNALWGLSLALCVVTLWLGYRTAATRLADCALSFFGIFILLRMLWTPVLGPGAALVHSHLAETLAVGDLGSALQWAVKGVVATLLLATMVSLMGKLSAVAHSASNSAA